MAKNLKLPSALRTLKSSQCNFATDGNAGLVRIEAEQLIGKKSSSKA
jgi:hypothetical protein